MGTIINKGDKPKNKITISKSGDSIHKLDPITNETDRSFAQPNPVTPPKEVEPKAHASAQDEVEALSENSTKGRIYKREDEGDEDAE